MFFKFCCCAEEDQDQSTNATRQVSQENYFAYSLPVEISVFPIVTATLVHDAKKNWPTIILMMSLGLRYTLGQWFKHRINMESATATTDPSFELLSVALWLNESEYLNALSANHHNDLAQYIASRNSEVDVAGHTLWFFANCGLAEEFINHAHARHLIPNKDSLVKPNREAYSNYISSLHCAAYSYNDEALRGVILRGLPIFHGSLFTRLAKDGCWHGLLICIVKNLCDPEASHVFDHFALSGYGEFSKQVQAYWNKLKDAPRSGFPDRTNLETLVKNPEIAELCFAYLVFRFNQRSSREPDITRLLLEETHIESNSANTEALSNNQIYYGNCLNILLRNCFNTPQPALLDLLLNCPTNIIGALENDVIDLLLPQLQEFYPHATPKLQQLLQQRLMIREQRTQTERRPSVSPPM